MLYALVEWRLRVQNRGRTLHSNRSATGQGIAEGVVKGIAEGTGDGD